MTTKVVTTLVCDLPHEEGRRDVEAQTVLIATPDGSWNLELCPQHLTLLGTMIRAGRRTPRRVRPGS